jgi:drug/metabolite transporter (DMT)-like permease
MSFVPVTTALLAWIVLGEALQPWEIAGIIGCSAGLLWYSREPKSQILKATQTIKPDRD